MKIEHIAIWATDIEKLRRFYETYFGAVANQKYVNAKKAFESYFLTFDGGARLELMQRPTVSNTGKEAPSQELLGYAHLALSVGSAENVDSLTQQLIDAGFTKLDGPRTTGDGYYESVILDPENNRIEITI